MKKYIFTDTKTGETFTVICEPHEVHSIDRTNKDLEQWCEGRIIYRKEEEIKLDGSDLKGFSIDPLMHIKQKSMMTKKDIKISKEFIKWESSKSITPSTTADII